MPSKKFSVTGMSCQHCVGNVKRAIESIEGVQSATVLQHEHLLKIEADPMPALDMLNKVLSEKGHYQVAEL